MMSADIGMGVVVEARVPPNAPQGCPRGPEEKESRGDNALLSHGARPEFWARHRPAPTDKAPFVP